MARLFHLDAFTHEAMRGAPAPVIALDAPVTAALGVAMANELNQQVTTFLHPTADGCAVRFFDPKGEIGLAGHASLAAGFVALTKLYPERDSIVLTSPIGGALPVTRRGDRIVLEFDSAPGTPVPEMPLLDATFRAIAIEARLTASFGAVAVLADEDAVWNLDPDFAKALQVPGDMVIATAPGRKADFVSRVFAPKYDLPEDPVCGTAHRVLTPYWAARLGRSRLTGHQISARGGHFECELQGGRVRLGGQAYLLFEGDIALPA